MYLEATEVLCSYRQLARAAPVTCTSSVVATLVRVMMIYYYGNIMVSYNN